MFPLKHLVRIKRQDPISLDGLQYEIDLVMVEKENRRESLAILTLDNTQITNNTKKFRDNKSLFYKAK